MRMRCTSLALSSAIGFAQPAAPKAAPKVASAEGVADVKDEDFAPLPKALDAFFP